MTRACVYASSAILWYCFNRLNIGDDVLWDGLAEACSSWHKDTAKKVWRRITERDPTHSAQTASVLESLKTSFTRSIEDNNVDLVTFLYDGEIVKPSLDDVGRAVRLLRLDMLRYFSDDATCPKNVAAKDLRAAIRSWRRSEDAFQESAPVFDFVMERFSVVDQEPQVVYKDRDLSQLLVQATYNMKDQRLKNYIRDYPYRRQVLAK
ncbi:hypothetical protein HK405_009226 [Cladochytrium tenue]|nr:hypothetical protein HK405_009226 [Cladochytrium tenue]